MPPRSRTPRPPTPRPSRPESDARRSAATRARLLDAAFECLLELGYAGTTTVEICRRAGAPRGTLLHHFPSRDELMLAAVGHVLERHLNELDAVFAEMQAGARRNGKGAIPVSGAIEELWKVVSGPTLVAWLELLVAARTAPALMRRFKTQMAAFDERVRSTYRTWFGDAAGDAAQDELNVTFTFAVLNGLALDWQYKPRGEVTPVLERFKAMAEGLLSPPAPRAPRAHDKGSRSR